MLKNSKRYKFFIKKSKDSEFTNYRQKKKEVLCDYTIEKYKKKMCYPQKNNSWL